MNAISHPPAPRKGERRASARSASGPRPSPGKPQLSIVLPVHNGEEFLAEALESIFAQTFADFELIAVNDCSTDSSGAILADFAARDPRMRIVTLRENAKLPGALNAGFAAARAKWLTWTSDDNLLLPDMIESLLAARDAYPHGDIFHAGYRIIDDAGQVIGHKSSEPADGLLRANVIGCCFLYRREVDAALGGYDETLFGAEDYDFWLRAARAGFTFIPVDEELYEYRRHDGSLTDRRWHENRKKVEQVLTREISLTADRRKRAEGWLGLFLDNPYRPNTAFLLRALRDDPRLVLGAWRHILGWARRFIGCHLR